MIKSSTQVTLADGRQMISFYTDTQPTSALITWENGSMTMPLSYDSATGSYVLTALVPAEEFLVKLNTEAVAKAYEAEWGELEVEEYVELQYTKSGSSWWTFKVPYCDLAILDLQLYTSTMVPLDVFRDRSKKCWVLASIAVENIYGQPTLIANIRILRSGTSVRQKGGVNWVNIGDLAGGFVVEVLNHTRATHDRVVNATICRNSLYDKKYRRAVT